jgi:hydroxymethylpyrimidine/phosphomethylpyrimidine kinase
VPKRPLKRRKSRATITSTIDQQLSACPPIALTIAGSDSSAGAGIQADLKTFSALGVYGLTAVTCVVAETPGKVLRIETVSPEIVREQIELVATNFPIAAIKTGLLCSSEIISAVASAIRGIAGATVPGIPLVVDPVIVATSGDPLLDANAVERYTKELFPLATVVTPNLPEAEKFLGESVSDLKAMRRAAAELSNRFGASVLLKGGHLAGDRAVDLLIADDEITEFPAPFIRNIATHGTGCTYSAAITAGLASGLRLKSAIEHGKEFVTNCIAHRLRWKSRLGKNLDALNHSI